MTAPVALGYLTGSAFACARRRPCSKNDRPEYLRSGAFWSFSCCRVVSRGRGGGPSVRVGRRGRGARHAGWVASARRCHRRRRGAEHHQTGEGPGIEDLVWLATEYAYTELVQHGVAAARYEAATTLDAAEVSLDTDGIDRITNPIEYYDPDNPQEPAPFDIAAINERLRKVAV